MSAESGLGTAQEMPHNLVAERSVLSVLLSGRHAAAIHLIRQAIEHPLIFYGRHHRLLYQVCLDLDDRGDRIDAHLVAETCKNIDYPLMNDRLRRAQLLDEWGDEAVVRFGKKLFSNERVEQQSCLSAIGGYAFIEAITQDFASLETVDDNCRLLQELYQRRWVITRLGHFADSAYRTTRGFAALADEGSQLFLDADRLRQGEQITTHRMTNVIEEAMRQIESASGDPEGAIGTGYAELDQLLGPMRPGGLYVLAARPGVGKTSFALNVIQQSASDPQTARPSLFISMEVDRLDLVKKLLCGAAGVSFKKMEQGDISEVDTIALTQCGDRFKQWRLGVVDTSDLSVQALRSIVKAYALEQRQELGMMVIDYLQLLSASKEGATEYEKITEISRTLKILARELRIPIIALSQMTRDADKGEQVREPRLSDLRGSGSIEQDADAVMFLHRVDAQDGPDTHHTGRLMKLIIGKNRFGPLGSIDMRFFPAKQRFVMIGEKDMLDAVPLNNGNDQEGTTDEGTSPVDAPGYVI